jgi:hypothetical protein
LVPVNWTNDVLRNFASLAVSVLLLSVERSGERARLGETVVTSWLAGSETAAHAPLPGATRLDADVSAYRGAVADVVTELMAAGLQPSVAAAERILTRRLAEPEFAVILSATPPGPEAAMRRVLLEVRTYRPSARNSAGNLAGMIRIALLSQIDLLWWGHLPAYDTDTEVLRSGELLDLDALRYGDMLLFRYRRQTSTLLGRAVRSAERLAVPGHAPRTAGLRFACARPELVVVLNQVAAEFRRLAPRGTPRLWVTSLTRSVRHQQHLRSLGYAAPVPSAHCVGFAADIEMAWFRQFGADWVLQDVLFEYQRAGDINVIDEGQAWHICVRPGAGRALRLIPGEEMGG